MTFTAYDASHSDFDSYVGDSPLDQRIARLHIPLLAIFGSEDQIVDSHKALAAYAGVPDAETALIQGSGHSPNVEKPVQTARLILRFAKPLDVAFRRSQQKAPRRRATKERPVTGAKSR
jgi:pimeloyl-ACP methyl ester carboxylesterase